VIRPQSRKGRARSGWLGLVLALGLPAAAARADGWLSETTGVTGDLFGSSVSELEDINQDPSGCWELLAGMPGDNTVVGSAGKVCLWYGGTNRNVTPDVVLTGQAPEQFGWVVARIGDVNHDGIADFAVGAPLASTTGAERGRVYVFYGDNVTSGTAAARADVIIDGQTGGDRFGWSLAAAGDFDGDGRDDFIVGAPLNDNRAQNAGAAYVIYGATGGPSTNLADATVLTGQIAEDHFGWAVSDAGNFLGTSAACVAVGAPLNNTHGGLDAGAVYVYEGRLAGATPDTTIDFAAGVGSASKAGAEYGFAVRNAGRWSGDGYDDLAIGAPYCDQGGLESGRVEIIFGGASPSTSGDRYLGGEDASGHLGWSLARGHDLVGTSAEDLLVGAPGVDAPATDAGRAYIFRGGSVSHASAADVTAGDIVPNVPLRAGTEPNDLFGTAVASAGDFDGDGAWDSAFGAPGGSSETAGGATGAASGFVRLVHSSAGPVAATLIAWRAAWLPAGDPGQVELAFALAAPDGDITGLDLERRVLDAAGRLVDAAPVWSGPAEPGAPRAGALTVDAAGYTFRDPGPAAPPAGGGLAYVLTATTTDGRTLALGEQAGPAGEAPVYGLAVAAVANPGRAQLMYRFRARAGDPVAVDVFDVRGRLVRRLHDGRGTGTWLEGTWDGRDESGQPAATGVYLLSARSPEGARSRRLTLVR
jgi:hypothetical protein